MSIESHEFPQLTYDTGPVRRVGWLVVELSVKPRKFFRDSVEVNYVTDPERNMPKWQCVDSGSIGEIADPELRYALRFADATNAAGRIDHGGGSSSWHDVVIEATEDARLHSATYSGRMADYGDDFMENLKRFDPDYDGHYSNQATS